jgi:capsular exopolysaccharide synthesis family protein
VTSPNRGDGKSFTSANVAMTIAMDGKSVVLIDADLRRPSQHTLHHVPSQPGLTDYLLGNRTLDEVLRETDQPNMQLIAAGPIPPNPSELLGSENFERLLRELEERFDMVVVDSAPCIPVTDPVIIAPRMDAVAIVLRTSSTRRGELRHALGLLERARTRVIGFVLNRATSDRGGYYSYNSYYGGGYGGGYGETPAAPAVPPVAGSNGTHRKRQLETAARSGPRSGREAGDEE